MSKIKIALLGIGKIARDQHIPTLQKSDAFELAAAVSSRATDLAVPTYKTMREMVAAHPEVRAISICTPPHGRAALVNEAFGYNLDVIIEKPPAGSLIEADMLAALGRDPGRVLFASWHSREAPAAEPARNWLKGKHVRRATIAWKEDVRVWHPGQEWIWDPGIGVFDPGINALSLMTAILPEPLHLDNAVLRYPSNRRAPIAADLTYRSGEAEVSVEFDFDQRGQQTWDIVVETDGGQLKLTMGGSNISVDGRAIDVGPVDEYAGLYRKFRELIELRRSEVDLTPFFHVADAFFVGDRETVGPFEWDS